MKKTILAIGTLGGLFLTIIFAYGTPLLAAANFLWLLVKGHTFMSWWWIAGGVAAFVVSGVVYVVSHVALAES